MRSRHDADMRAHALPAALCLLLARGGGGTRGGSGGAGDHDGAFLEGVRDLVYDVQRQVVLTAGIHGAVAVINVSAALRAPVLISTISPSSVVDAHGLAYDPVGMRV